MKNSHIQWCDHTFNPWEGCTKVSQGCAHCYAATRNERFHNDTNWGPGAPRRRTSAAYWKQPLQWNREAEASGVRARVFCASLADWLDPDVPLEWRADLLALIKATPHLDWQLLSKRPDLWRDLMWAVACMNIRHGDQGFDDVTAAAMASLWLNGGDPENVWIGTSVEDQPNADKRVPEVLNIPAAVRFLSCEPLLGDVDIRYSAFNGADSLSSIEGIHWVIVGGESGQGARPMDVEWARSLRDQCQAAGAAFFMKQLGGVRDKRGEIEDLPEDLRIREFPSTNGLGNIARETTAGET